MTKRTNTEPKMREFGTGLRDRLYHPARWRAAKPPERALRSLVRPR